MGKGNKDFIIIVEVFGKCGGNIIDRRYDSEIRKCIK